jgi:hypothetical protein
VADVMEAMCSHRPYRASLGLAETLDELTRNKGILYDAAVVEACLKLYWHDQPAFRQATDSPALRRGSMPLPPVSLGVGGGALPQVTADKSRHWVIPQRHRAWVHAGSASLMGWLIMASLKGF